MYPYGTKAVDLNERIIEKFIIKPIVICIHFQRSEKRPLWPLRDKLIYRPSCHYIERLSSLSLTSGKGLQKL